MANKDTYIPMSNLWDQVNTNFKYAKSGADFGTIAKSGASDVLKANGSSVRSAGLYAQTICDKDSGTITNYSLKQVVGTVQYDINASDITINGHKLNSQLYEFTNMKKVRGTAMGNFTTIGTMLVKAYDPNLKKWVLIRRQCRIPVFSNLLDSYAIDDRLSIADLEDVLDYKIAKDKDDGAFDNNYFVYNYPDQGSDD